MKILSLDVETFPQTILAWTSYEANALAVVEPSKICCYSAKWLDGKQVTKGLIDCKNQKSDKELVVELWDLLDQADIVVAHNGKRFDLPRINTRFLLHGLPPPSPYKVIDTLRTTKQVFGMESYKLDSICSFLSIGKKNNPYGFSLWTGCMAGNTLAWRRMKSYNRNDVLLLEELFLRIRPFIKMPNVSSGSSCPRCGEHSLQSRGTVRTTTREYKRFACTSCGGWSRDLDMTNNVSVTSL